MDFTQLTDSQRAAMLATIGAGQVEDLLADIPRAIRLRRPLKVAGPLDELELLRKLTGLADNPAARMTCFLGGGAYDHFIPTVVDALANRSEFVTAYTPYQAEASQGTLQAFYEFQTMVCELTGMEVANASLYEGGSAIAEAVLMAANISGKKRVVLSRAVHPHYQQVVATYLRQLPLKMEWAAIDGGVTDLAQLAGALDGQTACLVVQTPNFFGHVERLDKISQMARAAGVLQIVCVDPIAMAILKRPGELGADIVVGEGQPLGIPLSYGGPGLGLMATRKAHVRKMPGRLIGRTADAAGRPAYCLALQTREQHIRREKATSNVCTNEGLLAYRAAVYMAAMGRVGLTRVARLCLSKAHYAAERIGELADFELVWPRTPFFKEFLVRSKKRPVEEVLASAEKRGLLAGLPLRADWVSQLGLDGKGFENCLLVAVTEKRTKGQIDALVEALKGS